MTSFINTSFIHKGLKSRLLYKKCTAKNAYMKIKFWYLYLWFFLVTNFKKMKNIKKLKLSNQKKIHKLRLKCFGFLPSLDSLKNNNVIIKKNTNSG